MVSNPRISKGPAGTGRCINGDSARRGWDAETGHPRRGPPVTTPPGSRLPQCASAAASPALRHLHSLQLLLSESRRWVHGLAMEASVLANPPAAVMGKCMRPRSPSSCSRSCGGHAGRCSCPTVLASCGGDAGRFPRPRVNAPRHRCAHCRLATRGQRITGVGLPGSAHAAWRPQAHSGCAQQGRERWGGPAHMGQARARAASAARRFQRGSVGPTVAQHQRLEL